MKNEWNKNKYPYTTDILRYTSYKLAMNANKNKVWEKTRKTRRIRFYSNFAAWNCVWAGTKALPSALNITCATSTTITSLFGFPLNSSNNKKCQAFSLLSVHSFSTLCILLCFSLSFFVCYEPKKVTKNPHCFTYLHARKQKYLKFTTSNWKLETLTVFTTVFFFKFSFLIFHVAFDVKEKKESYAMHTKHV